MTEQSQPAPSAGQQRAIRLTFAYDGEEVRLVSRQSVEMLVPQSDPVEGYTGHQGCWCELQDAEGKILFRRLLPNAIRTDVEGVSDDPGHPLTRRPVERPQGVFIALVPDLEGADAVSIWNSPLPAAGAAREAAGPAAREIARFPLRGGEGAAP